MIQSLFLEHFRNYSKKEFLFTSPLVLITGENGKGKTNILEALSALVFVKPFRSGKKEVFIEHNAGFGRVKGKTDTGEVLEVFWGIDTGSSLQIKRNDVACSTREYLKYKSLHAVLFSPEDLNLPILSPQYRRNFISRLLSSLFPEYFHSALEYKSLLKQRNALLKRYSDNLAQRSEFEFWDTELQKHQSVLSEYHADFCNFANVHFPEEYCALSGKKEPVLLEWISSLEEGVGYMESLRQCFEKDVFKGATQKGVHRDDFILSLRGVPVHEGASRGESRSVLLALKKIEQMFITKHTGNAPLLLLDDVFSELDYSHQTHLLSSLNPSQQCIITTTHVDIPLPPEWDIQHIQI